MKYSQKTLHSSPERARYGVSFVSSKGNILCRLIKIELYKIFAIINRAIKGLHCNELKTSWVWWGNQALSFFNHWGRVTHICVSNDLTIIGFMACRLVGAKSLSEPMLECCLLNPGEQISMKSSNIFIQEDAFENFVCEMASILPWPKCVK